MGRTLIRHWRLFLYLVIFYTRESLAAADERVPCEYCCSHLFSTSKGIINVRENSSLFHSISYIIRCSMSAAEVVIISDSHSPNLAHQRLRKKDEFERKRRVCTRTENVLLSYIKATDFLESNPGYFQKIVATSHPGRNKSVEAVMSKRTNFIFIPNSNQQMLFLITKVEHELRQLRTNRNSFWQPYVVFLWPEVLYVLGNDDGNTSYHVLGETLLHSWLDSLKPNYALDSGIFFIFMVQKGNSSRSQTSLYLSIWECYKLKGQFIIQEITELSEPAYTPLEKHEKCEAMLSVRTTLSWMEKVNSYIFVERFSRRDNFRLLPVTASVSAKEFSEASDWVTVKRSENGTVELGSGASVKIYKDLQKMINFSEQVLLGDHVQYIVVDENASFPTAFNGNVDMADILLDQKSVTPFRGEIYSFLQPTYLGIYGAFFRQPSDDAIRNIVSAPFTAGLWIIFIGTWVLIAGCLSCWGYIAKRNYVCTTTDNDFIQEVPLWAVSAITQKSWYTSPSSSNFRAIFFIGSTMALICYVAYSAVIVSFLTVKIIPIRSLSDLITYNYKFTVHESSEVTISLLHEMIDQYNLSQSVLKINTENEITHLNERTRALISYPDLFYGTASAQNFTEKFLCTSIDTLPATNMPYKTAMSVRKASQYRETLSSKLLIIIERGLNFRYKRIFEDNKVINCPKKTYNNGEKDTIDPVRITDVFTTFLIIFIGWLAAVWMFITERIYRRRKTMYDLLFILH